MTNARNSFLSMGPRVHAALKWVVMLVLPAIAMLYLAMAKLWGLPNAAEIVSSITALAAFLGVLLGVSSVQYNKDYTTTSDDVAHAFWMLTDRAYSVLKWFTALILPAFAALYYALAETWGLPYATEIVGSIAAIVVFMVVILGLGRITLKNKPNFLNFSNDVYDTLKWIVIQILPATGVVYAAMAKTWGLPFVTEVVATIAAVTLFLGVLLGISTANYAAKSVRG